MIPEERGATPPPEDGEPPRGQPPLQGPAEAAADPAVTEPVVAESSHPEELTAVERAHAKAKQRHDELAEQAGIALKALRERAPRSLDEAILRFREHQRDDPYPGIRPGLLPSSAACAYIAQTGMVYPFSFSQGEMQLASVDLPLLGKAVWWDDKGERNELEIKENTPFRLPPNSIAFVTLKPYLQLPDYIALRFNLRVRHVYRGLLLGTGPLVDPGYQGYLAIPLHNLTNNDYTFYGGEGLIAVEFTKLDPSTAMPALDLADPSTKLARPPEKFMVPFPEPRHPHPGNESDHPIVVNFRKAGVLSVESSLPPLTERMREHEEVVTERLAAQDKSISGFRNGISIVGAISILGVVFTIVTIAWGAVNEFRAIAAREKDTVERMQTQSKAAVEAQQKIAIDSLTALREHQQRIEAAICAEATAGDTTRALSRALTKLCP